MKNLTLDANLVTRRRIVQRRFTIADINVEDDDQNGSLDLNGDQNGPPDMDVDQNGSLDLDGDPAQPPAPAPNVAPAQPSLLGINRRDKTFMKRRQSSKV